MMSISRFGVAALVFSIALMVLPSGCRKESDSPAGVELHPTAVTVKHYRLEGMVLATSAATSEITIKHGDIPGFMPAMTMVY